jgi:hypothetical protein
MCDLCGKSSKESNTHFNKTPMQVRIKNHLGKYLHVSCQISIQAEDDVSALTQLERLMNKPVENEQDERKIGQLMERVENPTLKMPLLCNSCKKEAAYKILTGAKFPAKSTLKQSPAVTEVSLDNQWAGIMKAIDDLPESTDQPE